MFRKIMIPILQTLVILTVCILSACILTPQFQPTIKEESSPVDDVQIMNRFESIVDTAVSQAREAALSVPVVYMIPKDAAIAPKPDQSKFGSTTNPKELGWLLEEAAHILEGQETLFSTDIQTYPGTLIHYYLDDTIFAVTWKQVFDNFVYTISEIKVAHASQFRRHLAGNAFGSYDMNYTTKFAQKVNAVVASSADFYLGRRYGIRVYQGEVKKLEHGEVVDTCYVDKDGDLHFSYAGEILDMETAQKFVDDNEISFSMSFGPIIIDNGVRVDPDMYLLGEITGTYPRAAIGQRDKLHYVLVVANGQGPYWQYPTLRTFAKNVETFGCDKVYTLDGGQTGVIAVNGKLINQVQFGSQRLVSDIIYFATAMPENMETGSDS